MKWIKDICIELVIIHINPNKCLAASGQKPNQLSCCLLSWDTTWLTVLRIRGTESSVESSFTSFFGSTVSVLCAVEVKSEPKFATLLVLSKPWARTALQAAVGTPWWRPVSKVAPKSTTGAAQKPELKLQHQVTLFSLPGATDAKPPPSHWNGVYFFHLCLNTCLLLIASPQKQCFFSCY